MQTREQDQGVTQYVRLASVLRHRIVHGDLAPGQRLPTVAELAAEHGVARITARQAYAVLAREGLVNSARGRGTFVADGPLGTGAGLNPALRAAINDLGAEDLRIEIAEQRQGGALPPALRGAFREYPAYDFVRKRHIHGGEPFCLIELYVASELRQRFPPGAEHRHKISWLLNRHAGETMHEVRQTLTVAPADLLLARELDCPFATPIAHMTRHVLDVEGRIAFAGRFWYRGDRFAMDSHIPFAVWQASPGVVIPDYHPAG